MVGHPRWEGYLLRTDTASGERLNTSCRQELLYEWVPPKLSCPGHIILLDYTSLWVLCVQVTSSKYDTVGPILIVPPLLLYGIQGGFSTVSQLYYHLSTRD